LLFTSLLDCNFWLFRESGPTEELHCRACIGVPLSVPQFNALDYAAIAGQVDQACILARTDVIAHWNLFSRTVTEVHDNMVEIDTSAADPELDCLISPFGARHPDIVVVCMTINVRFAEEYQSAVLSRSDRSQAQNKCECSDP
jgi:hypothetical protein